MKAVYALAALLLAQIAGMAQRAPVPKLAAPEQASSATGSAAKRTPAAARAKKPAVARRGSSARSLAAKSVAAAKPPAAAKLAATNRSASAKRPVAAKPAAPARKPVVPALPVQECSTCLDGVVAKALTLLGNRYRYGGSSPATGFDCAGLVRYVFQETCRLALPSSATLQFQWGLPIGKAALRAGDLVFFRTSRVGWHVGLYIGDGKFIHAPNRRRVVSVSLLDEQYYKRAFRGARRLLPQAPLEGVQVPDVLLDDSLLEHSSNPPATIQIPFPASAAAPWNPGS